MIGLLGLSGSFVRAAALTGMILLAVAMSMLVSRLLSATALRGMEFVRAVTSVLRVEGLQ